MTTLQSVVRRRRAVAAAGAVSAGLLVLAACDKPTPMATVTVGTSSASSEAECYEEGGRGLGRAKATKCSLARAEHTISVEQGETLRIGVDREIADEGWALWINGQQVTSPFKKTYYAFEGVDLFATQQGQATQKTLKISVVQQNETGSEIHGVWNFRLKNADA